MTLETILEFSSQTMIFCCGGFGTLFKLTIYNLLLIQVEDKSFKDHYWVFKATFKNGIWMQTSRYKLNYQTNFKP